MSSNQLYINGRFLTQPITGVNRYAYERCRKMLREGTAFTLVCPHGKLSSDYDLEGMTVRRFGWGHSHFWAQLVLPWFFVFKRHATLLCLMGLAPLLIPHTVMTIHDLAFLYNPRWYSRAYYLFYRWMTPLCARHAEQIITVSNASKQDILTRYPFLNEHKITVIPPEINTRFFTHAAVDRLPFVLAVASLAPRKNLPRLVRAVAADPALHLKIVGGTNRVFAETGIPHATNVEMLGRVTDNDLRHLYRTAAGFIYPSLFEGFGIPPIEALACGCPVAVADIPVLHETCDPYLRQGLTVLYFDPTDETAILSAVKRLINNIQR